MNQSDSLPVPPADALAQSRQLVAHIAARIAARGGWIPFAEYMELALYAPGLGYYSGGAQKFGADGDFTTAPELSPLFGRTLAQQLAEVFEAMSSAAPAVRDDDAGAGSQAVAVLEFGAGTGRLAADLLIELDRLGRLPASYQILELSGELRARQHATIAQRCAAAGRAMLVERVRWLDALPARFRGVMLGNEVLDAMPVQVWSRSGGVWNERGVTLAAAADEGCMPAFAWADRAVAQAPAELQAVAGDDAYVTETHAAAQGFMRSVAAALDCGVVLLADYGFPQAEYYHSQRAQGTLMGHYRHRAHGDPFLHSGLSDITAHVNFTAIAEAATEAGLDLLGYTSQARFLMNAGIVELLATLDPTDVKTYLPASNAAQKLLSEAEMGELFKVIAFGKGVDLALAGFARGDRCHAL